mmetsp:Transcript_20074/g.36087  ORF Transcript_20074/g.36087 Transcript_20074/m.36087 type:complete len:280 (-) Transcript_20074:291-1130(-)|eukprot:CAMPEP_0175039408 /NCGR_PEP_ID=MMETSP0052_2-20121109/558_1 /TAXON_ID=51329 ORGANISM="Polytomella parva, Strain SAG 63-3" /NCGR_SAMPLE_ID=MMETSP0052_2 /ASSEMBLY_ACC=CAM_ASM_000194 /LENGTH=279 /DNA_ID=CAMNT_0016301239 /DNA_START=159 /DNA_END=998 /DNA_ORIENTATION=+
MKIEDSFDLATLISVGILGLAVAFWVYRKVTEPPEPSPFLKPDTFQALTLAERKEITPNTFLFRFVLPFEKQKIGLPTGQHITFLAKDSEGKDIYRPYTPVTDDQTPGYVDFIIKLYPTGKMSQILAPMKCGSRMLMKGPKGRFTYNAHKYKTIGMIAGGTGITPMYQIINAILNNPKDLTKISLVYGSLSLTDIILKKELDVLSVVYPERFKLHYVLNEAPEYWDGSIGFVTKDILKEKLAPPGSDNIVLRCGPPLMMKAMEDILPQLGYSEEEQFQF